MGSTKSATVSPSLFGQYKAWLTEGWDGEGWDVGTERHRCLLEDKVRFGWMQFRAQRELPNMDLAEEQVEAAVKHLANPERIEHKAAPRLTLVVNQPAAVASNPTTNHVRAKPRLVAVGGEMPTARNAAEAVAAAKRGDHETAFEYSRWAGMGAQGRMHHLIKDAGDYIIARRQWLRGEGPNPDGERA